MNRRDFLTRLSIMLSGLVGVLVSIPVIGSLIAPFLSKFPRKWRKVGRVEKFKTGETVLVNFEDSSTLPWAGTTAKTGAWLRKNSEEDFVAFSVDCTHLGCPVRWVPKSHIFLCPCHGGVFYRDGSRAGGPPNKPLNKYPVRVKNGDVEIRTSPLPITNMLG